jgi:hypothetical protein
MFASHFAGLKPGASTVIPRLPLGIEGGALAPPREAIGRNAAPKAPAPQPNDFELVRPCDTVMLRYV